MAIDGERRRKIIEELNAKIGSDTSNLEHVYKLHSEYLEKKKELEESLSLASDEVPLKVSLALQNADSALQKIKTYQDEIEVSVKNNEEFMRSVEPIRDHLNDLTAQLNKLKLTKEYMQSLKTIQDLSYDLQKCTDSEQSVLLLQQLYEFSKKYPDGHRGDFIRETTHYWFNILKDKLSKDFDEILKQIKWPITSTTISLTTNVPVESLNKFKQTVQYLLQIQMPAENDRNIDTQEGVEQHLCLPIRLMLVPLKKRFAFHFSGNRRTNRLDRPEWFLTQVLSWLRDHLPFLSKHLQPIINGLDMKINVQVEFTCGLVQLAVDRLHVLLSTTAGDDSLFSHAIDECLGFDRELEKTVGFILPSLCPRVTTVLTDARYLTRWLAVEKKFAVQKIDEILSGKEWLLSIKGETVESNEDMGEIPQGADWLLSVLQTIHDRYSLLPQPGHRLQFLEMQIELCEEIRVRLTQLVGEELRYGTKRNNKRTLEEGTHLLSMINVAHYFRQALIDWTHSISYLHLHYYKKQFHCFTEMQHMPIPDIDTTPQRDVANISENIDDDDDISSSLLLRRGSLSLNQVESDACQLAEKEANAQEVSLNTEEESESDAGVFEELPSLFGLLVDNACTLICEDLMLEIKSVLKDYRNQKWHHMPEVKDWQCLSLSAVLCIPFGSLSGRLTRLKSSLAPELFAPLWRTVAKEIDKCIYDDIVLECWWGAGGIQQFHFDMRRNLVPIFAQYTSSPEAHLSKIHESCIVLTMLKGTALLLKETIKDSFVTNISVTKYAELGILHLDENDILRVLNQRTDMNLVQ